MNKAEVIENIVKKTGLTKTDAGAALETTLETIAKGAKKDKVSFVGFGTFEVKTRKARKGVNPATGEKIKIKAKKVLTFKPSKAPKY